MAGNFRPPSAMMSRFQQNNIGRPVTGWSGIVPFAKPTMGSPIQPVNAVKRIRKK